MDPNTVRKIRKIVFNWQFITISIIIHLILVTYVGRKTIFKRSGEGSDFTSEDGDGAYRCMQAALRRAQIDATEIDYVNAHGTSTMADGIELGAAFA